MPVAGAAPVPISVAETVGRIYATLIER